MPSVLVCSGQNVPYHAGLEYQICPDRVNCKYFRWLAPDLVEAAERRHRDSPANGAPPYPPQDFQHSESLPFLSQIDPQLLGPSYSPSPSSSQPSLPPASQTVKPHCARHPKCTRVAGSKDCSYKMCKPCCEGQRKGCKYPGHRTRPVPSVSAPTEDPSVLARPPPMFAYQTTESLDPSSSDSALAPKVYKKDMDSDWVRKYKANHEERDRRKEAEDKRRLQDLLYERQIRVCCWSENGVDPETVRQQGLVTWPNSNIADFPSLLKKLGLTAEDEIYIYDLMAGAGTSQNIAVGNIGSIIYASSTFYPSKSFITDLFSVLIASFRPPYLVASSL
ncbi:hypothetical protein C8J57DRAFT_1509596 [Mycena rebaudengoi]|nr:hypothetical protein C8J57DRAFT_1509596 [Mycena rebaudengoi]